MIKINLKLVNLTNNLYKIVVCDSRNRRRFRVVDSIGTVVIRQNKLNYISVLRSDYKYRIDKRYLSNRIFKASFRALVGTRINTRLVVDYRRLYYWLSLGACLSKKLTKLLFHSKII